MMCLASMSGSASPSLRRHGDAPLPSQPRRPLDHLDLVLAHEIGDAVRQPLGDFAAALDHAGEVEADIVGGEPELGGAAHRVIELGGAEQRLGRDAAPVETDAAEMLALDDRGLEAELGGADRGDIAAGPRADHGEIEAASRSSPTPAWSPGLR